MNRHMSINVLSFALGRLLRSICITASSTALLTKLERVMPHLRDRSPRCLASLWLIRSDMNISASLAFLSGGRPRLAFLDFIGEELTGNVTH